MNYSQLVSDLRNATEKGMFKAAHYQRGEQHVFLLGETHIKTSKSKKLGQEVLKNFEGQGIVGCEGIRIENYAFWARWVMRAMFFVLYTLTKPFSKNSTISCAKSTSKIKTFDLEEKQHPHWREYLAFGWIALIGILICFGWLLPSPEESWPVWILYYIFIHISLYECIAAIWELKGWETGFPSVVYSGLCLSRDKYMTEAILENIQDGEPMLTITGMLHLPGMEKRLQEAGFIKVPSQALPLSEETRKKLAEIRVSVTLMRKQLFHNEL